MRYEKPIVLDLNRRVRPALGGPDACLPGATAGGACATGTSPSYSPCAVGTSDGSTDCAPGSAPGMNCLSGLTAAVGACNSGGSGASDVTGCTMGNAVG